MARKGNDYDSVLKDGVFILSRPYKYGDGPERTVLDFPLRELTGQHIRTAHRNYEMIEGEGGTIVPEMSKVWQAYVAAALMKAQPDFVFDLPAADFTELTMIVQRFLLGAA